MSQVTEANVRRRMFRHELVERNRMKLKYSILQHAWLGLAWLSLAWPRLAEPSLAFPDLTWPGWPGLAWLFAGLSGWLAKVVCVIV